VASGEPKPGINRKPRLCRHPDQQESNQAHQVIVIVVLGLFPQEGVAERQKQRHGGSSITEPQRKAQPCQAHQQKVRGEPWLRPRPQPLKAWIREIPRSSNVKILRHAGSRLWPEVSGNMPTENQTERDPKRCQRGVNAESQPRRAMRSRTTSIRGSDQSSAVHQTGVKARAPTLRASIAPCQWRLWRRLTPSSTRGHRIRTPSIRVPTNGHRDQTACRLSQQHVRQRLALRQFSGIVGNLVHFSAICARMLIGIQTCLSSRHCVAGNPVGRMVIAVHVRTLQCPFLP
jgi:hypothetical protein